MNGKKVLVTGSNGMLGTNLLRQLPYEIVGYDSLTLDVTDFEKCTKILNCENPNIIIHTASYTNVEGCEINHDKAYKVNVIGTQNLVNYCINKEILFIYISSTGIYGNLKQKEPYNEFDEVNPTTIHHKSKYEAEKIIQNHLNKYLILRTGWLFGGDIKHNKNFVYKRYLESLDNKEIFGDNSQIGNPTYINDFIKQIKVLVESNQYGIFNCVNKACNTSRYKYVSKIIELFKSNCTVKIGTEDMFKRVAPVSKNESALNYKLDLLNKNVMPDWYDSLKIYINILQKEIDND